MITKGLQDYIELIYNAMLLSEEIRAVDIANKFNISRASVSEALIRLSDLDLIIYKGRKGIIITEKGMNEAKKIIRKHKVLSDFFEKILNINPEISSQNACKIEHVIDDLIIDKIETYTNCHSVSDTIRNKNE